MTLAVHAEGVSYVTDGGVVLVDRADLAVPAGVLQAIVGPNGAGKSTLLRMLAGELKPSAGVVRLAGEDLGGLTTAEAAERRAVLPQQTVLQFAFRCLDVIMMGRYRLGGAGDDEALGRVMAATDTQYLSQRIYPTLSGGEQARVSLARVLAQEAPILLLDEPTASLDLRHQELVMATLRGICAGGGAVVAVVHDLNLAARHADRVAMMGGGRVVAQGGVADVLTAALVGRVYRQPVEVLDHPTLGHPVIFPTS